DGLARRQLAEDRAREQIPGAIGEPALTYGVAHPFVVDAIGEHELDLVARPEVIEVRPSVPVRLAAARALEIPDLVDARVDTGDVGFAAGLDEHRAPGVAELGHQREDSGLEERLAARQPGEPRRESGGPRE